MQSPPLRRFLVVSTHQDAHAKIPNLISIAMLCNDIGMFLSVSALVRVDCGVWLAQVVRNRLCQIQVELLASRKTLT
jgi:hypothetical protein